ncbi:nucleotidyl transferase AbiEii/AbiGii toxin family protein, partial [bacterium]|nr:nucleotidyl transferase AbiEii/AbiGii toxin family protein [bacterium]
VHALVILGMANSRMKDFYDLYVLLQLYSFESSDLVRAVKATFIQRKTSLPGNTPVALTGQFAEDESKNIQWHAFLNRNHIENAPLNLGEVIQELNMKLEGLWRVEVE